MQAQVKQFNPVDMDRTVIALPLMRAMQEDEARIALLKQAYPDAPEHFNAAVEYNASFPGGSSAARDVVLEFLAQATSKTLEVTANRVAKARPEEKAAEEDRQRRLEEEARDQTVEPPMEKYPYSLARLHASVIRRMMALNDGRSSAKPMVAIHPARFEIIIDLNLEHRGGRSVARSWVVENIEKAKTESGVRDSGQGVHMEKNQPDSQYLFARLEGRAIRRLVELDIAAAQQEAEELRTKAQNEAVRNQIDSSKCRSIFHIWPDFDVSACINKSIATVKCDAAQNSFSAMGGDITWAVMDSGINGRHHHFATHGNVDMNSTLHKDFTVDGSDPFDDENGHGTHVAGIIAGEWRDDPKPLAISRYLKTNTDDVELLETRLDGISGMAPRCKLVSLRVLDAGGKGSVSNIIAAIDHVQEINGYGRHLIIHGVNMSLGYTFEPEWFACGQSPLCAEVDRLVKTGVVVVVAAGNTGYGTLKSTIGATTAGMALTINDPGNSDLAITVGSTHRDMPHVYGVSYFSSKGPTGDGRLKPDLVAPGEKIISCAAGALMKDAAKGKPCDYVETSGTSMAAPHVSGAIAAFLSVRREFIGNAERVKEIFVSTSTDLRRDRYFQGAGLVDLMRAIQSV
jgi:hypothetical protein